jgi:hypothetical protein
MIAKLRQRLVCHQRTTSNRRKENTIKDRASRRSRSIAPRRSLRRTVRRTARGHGNRVGTSEGRRFDHLSKGSGARFRRGHHPGISFLLLEQSKLTPPVGTAITPKEEGDHERIAIEGAEVDHKEAHSFRRNPEFESRSLSCETLK